MIPKVRDIIMQTALKHSVAAKDILSRRRTTPVCLARDEAYARIYAETKLSYTQVGGILDRDHASVIIGARRHRERSI